jgi:hypothetical protein
MLHKNTFPTKFCPLLLQDYLNRETANYSDSKEDTTLSDIAARNISSTLTNIGEI